VRATASNPGSLQQPARSRRASNASRVYAATLPKKSSGRIDTLGQCRLGHDHLPRRRLAGPSPISGQVTTSAAGGPGQPPKFSLSCVALRRTRPRSNHPTEPEVRSSPTLPGCFPVWARFFAAERRGPCPFEAGGRVLTESAAACPNGHRARGASSAGAASPPARVVPRTTSTEPSRAPRRRAMRPTALGPIGSAPLGPRTARANRDLKRGPVRGTWPATSPTKELPCLHLT